MMKDTNNFFDYFRTKLYISLFGNPDKIRNISSNPEELKQYLTEEYNKTKDNSPEGLTEKDEILKPEVFDSQIVPLNDDSQLLVITLPHMQSPTKTTFAGIVLGEKLRYFELSSSKDERTGKFTGFIFEFGARGPLSDHFDSKTKRFISKPAIETPSFEAFVEGVKAMLPTVGMKAYYDAKAVPEKKSLWKSIKDFFKKLFTKK